ncbi:hypothetical protein V8D89_000275 [Ganoderma adspersum]
MLTFVQLLYGPMFIGVVFNVVLYGVMFTQTYMYFNMYKDDHRWIKVYVFVLFLCDTVNTALDIGAIYHPLVNQFGDLEALTRANWMFASDSATTAVVASLVECFFAWRVKVLTSNKWIVGVIVLCSITQLLGGIGGTITLTIEPSFAGVRRFRVIGIIWNTAGALADVIIAAALVWHLRDHKTGMTVTDSLINKIIRISVQTGFITALFAVMTLILYFTSSAGYDLIFHMPLAKLYTNSLMSTLNSRRMWLADACDHSGSTGPNGQRSRVNVNVLRGESAGRKSKSARVTDRIVIGVESHQMTDFADVKDDHYAPSSMSLVPEENSSSTSEGMRSPI